MALVRPMSRAEKCRLLTATGHANATTPATTAAVATTSRTRPTRGTAGRVAGLGDDTEVDSGVVISKVTTLAVVDTKQEGLTCSSEEVTTTDGEAVVAEKL